MQTHPTARAERVAGLTAVLLDALRSLAAAGQPETASQLAGRAYVVLRREHPALAQRINALMHGLTRTSNTIKEQSMPTNDPHLDVRTEPPARRHELIFDTVARLAAGRAFVLVNDHDPKPLYYQLAAEHPGQFSWDYLERGPEVWRVRIGRPARRRPPPKRSWPARVETSSDTHQLPHKRA